MIILDTNFFINLLDTKDKHHERAKKILKKIEKKEKVVTDGVILESITISGSLYGGKKATELYHNIKDNYTIFNTNHLYDKGMNTHLKYDGTLSLVDTLLIEAMKELGIHEIVSFDEDFDNKDGVVRIH
ncbi:MAG: type II toxin-antitoxin system VapC family toxin [Methanobrevibacter sp. CfCl-M3]